MSLKKIRIVFEGLTILLRILDILCWTCYTSTAFSEKQVDSSSKTSKKLLVLSESQNYEWPSVTLASTYHFWAYRIINQSFWRVLTYWDETVNTILRTRSLLMTISLPTLYYVIVLSWSKLAWIFIFIIKVWINNFNKLISLKNI